MPNIFYSNSSNIYYQSILVLLTCYLAGYMFIFHDWNLEVVSMCPACKYLCFLLSFLLVFGFWYHFMSFLGFGWFFSGIVLTTRQGLWVCQINSHSAPRRDWKSSWWSSTSSAAFCPCRKKPWTKKISKSEFELYFFGDIDFLIQCVWTSPYLF